MWGSCVTQTKKFNKYSLIYDIIYVSKARHKTMANFIEVTEKLCEDAKLEYFWQKKLERLTGLHHTYLKYGHSLNITDLSDHNVLIEIKHAAKVREAIGQILFYEAIMKEKRHKVGEVSIMKVLVIFNATWCEKVEALYKQLCNDLDIHLVLFDNRNVIKDDYEALLSILRPKCKHLDGLITLRKHLDKFSRKTKNIEKKSIITSINKDSTVQKQQCLINDLQRFRLN